MPERYDFPPVGTKVRVSTLTPGGLVAMDAEFLHVIVQPEGFLVAETGNGTRTVAFFPISRIQSVSWTQTAVTSIPPDTPPDVLAEIPSPQIPDAVPTGEGEKIDRLKATLLNMILSCGPLHKTTSEQAHKLTEQLRQVARPWELANP